MPAVGSGLGNSHLPRHAPPMAGRVAHRRLDGVQPVAVVKLLLGLRRCDLLRVGLHVHGGGEVGGPPAPPGPHLDLVVGVHALVEVEHDDVTRSEVGGHVPLPEVAVDENRRDAAPLGLQGAQEPRDDALEELLARGFELGPRPVDLAVELQEIPQQVRELAGPARAPVRGGPVERPATRHDGVPESPVGRRGLPVELRHGRGEPRWIGR